MSRFLFANPFGIGDTIFSLLVVEALKKQLPSASVGFLCNERTETLVRMAGTVAACHVLNRDQFRAEAKNDPRLFLGH